MSGRGSASLVQVLRRTWPRKARVIPSPPVRWAPPRGRGGEPVERRARSPLHACFAGPSRGSGDAHGGTRRASARERVHSGRAGCACRLRDVAPSWGLRVTRFSGPRLSAVWPRAGLGGPWGNGLGPGVPARFAAARSCARGSPRALTRGDDTPFQAGASPACRPMSSSPRMSRPGRSAKARVDDDNVRPCTAMAGVGAARAWACRRGGASLG